MNAHQTTIRIYDDLEIHSGQADFIGQVRGEINAENFVRLMRVLSIESNPRMPIRKSVTQDIFNSLSTTSDIFHLKTKGIVLSARSCQQLDRHRYMIDFESDEYARNGILDGGHNVLAIATFLLSFVLDQDELKKVRNWDSLKSAWHAHEDEVADLFKVPNLLESVVPFFLIPIEIIFPRIRNNPELLMKWGEYHREITYARNNNAQLTESTQDNHVGYYDYLKETLPAAVRGKIEWKTNDNGTIKAADVISLALIPLSKLPQEMTGVTIPMTKIYNSKQYCVDTYREILDKPGNGQLVGQFYTLTSDAVKSALDLVPRLIETYDFIYASFPTWYNKAGGSFGSIKGVRLYDPRHERNEKYSHKPFATKFYGHPANYQYGDGFFIPMVAALRELMVYDSKSKRLTWSVDPIDFLSASGPEILRMYISVIQNENDPQKLGKGSGFYVFMEQAVRFQKMAAAAA